MSSSGVDHANLQRQQNVATTPGFGVTVFVDPVVDSVINVADACAFGIVLNLAIESVVGDTRSCAMRGNQWLNERRNDVQQST